jgi:hypothetical protein
MARLVVGRFDDIVQANRLLDALREDGFALGEYGLFYTAPPGQHALHPIGGDAHSDEGAKDAGKTAAAGAAVGGATGMALGVVAAVALPATGVLAAIAATGLGAYIGSLYGALLGARSGDPSRATREQPVEQPGGLRVAICVNRAGAETRALALLACFEAKDIGRAEGAWRRRVWEDFDPRVPPQPVAQADER